MARAFSQATAEQVIRVSEAAVALRNDAEMERIARYTDLPSGPTTKALALSVDLGLLSIDGGKFVPASPLCQLLRTPQEKERAAVIRVTIENYEPFVVFREEHEATKDASEAANRTKARLDLEGHREEIKDTLVSLATYSGALTVSHGNTYERDNSSMGNLLEELAIGSGEEAAAIHAIRKELGQEAAGLVDHNNVLMPLAASLRHASGGGTGREAAQHAGNAMDSFLDWYAEHVGGDLRGATGINAKLDKLQRDNHLPKKLVFIGKYVGHVRNAADHGVDRDVAAAWDISDATGRNIVFVAARFISSVIAFNQGQFTI